MGITFDKSLRLPIDQFYNEQTAKFQIYIHHTVGGSVKSTFDWWMQDNEKVGTAYIVDQQGKIYEVFDPHCWAWHLGLKSANNTRANKQSIGIEMASEGGLYSGAELNKLKNVKTFDENWLYAFGGTKKLYQIGVDAGKYVDLGNAWRGFKYFDAYDEAQISSVIDLVKYLCDTFNIPKQTTPLKDKFSYDPTLVDKFYGILTHCNVRDDKSDANPSFDWARLERVLNNQPNIPQIQPMQPMGVIANG